MHELIIRTSTGTHVQIDPTTKKQRDTLFWRLNALDKALSLILSRSPIFQRDLMNAIQSPTLEELLSTRPRSDGMPILFEAHFDQQMYLLSRVQAEVWHCLPGQETHNVDHVRKDLESWYTEAAEACLCLSRPLLQLTIQTDPRGICPSGETSSKCPWPNVRGSSLTNSTTEILLP